MYFRCYGLRKSWLDKCLKGSETEDPLTDNIANGLKHCFYMKDSTFTTFINHCEVFALDKVSFSDMQNRKILS